MREHQPRVLIVGAGSIGERHIRCFARAGARVAVCDVDAAKAAGVAARYEVDDVHADLEQALAASFDAVVIATPAPLHVPMAERALESGCHALVEKPLSTSLEGVERLALASERARRVVAVAYVWRAHPVLSDMRREIASGRFGAPLQVVARCGQSFPAYRPAFRETYYRDRATGGGAIQDALTHIVNAVEWIVGPVTRVAADGAHLALDGVRVEDTVHAIARHGDVLASYSLNQHQAPNELELTVVCAGGTCRAHLVEGRWESVTAPDTPWTVELEAMPERDDVFVRQAETFLRAIAGRGDPLCDLAAGVQTLRVNLAMLRSMDAGAGLIEIGSDTPVRP